MGRLTIEGGLVMIIERTGEMTTTRYKLTTQDRKTHGSYALPEAGEWYYPANRTDAPEPCSDTVLHHYADPLLAVLFNPIHGNYAQPRLFEIEIDEEIGTDGLKGWCRAQRIVREMPLPTITTEQLIAFVIYCAEPYCTNPNWIRWATNWMNGADRTAESARTARTAESAWAARAAEWAAARMARTAARAAWTAEWAARAGQPCKDFMAIIKRVVAYRN